MVFKQYQIIWQLREASASNPPSNQQDGTASLSMTAKGVESAISSEPQLNSASLKVTETAESCLRPQATVIWSEWQKLPYSLRQKRADIFIEQRATVDFLQSLCAFLTQKQLKLLPYDDKKRYLPSDILLLSQGQVVDAGTVCYLQSGKHEVWSFLKQCFPNRL